MNEADRVRLHHMLDAAREVVMFSQGHNRGDLEKTDERYFLMGKRLLFLTAQSVLR